MKIQVKQVDTYVAERERLGHEITSHMEQYDLLRPQLEQVAHGLEDKLYPSAVATKTLSDVTKRQ